MHIIDPHPVTHTALRPHKLTNWPAGQAKGVDRFPLVLNQLARPAAAGLERIASTLPPLIFLLLLLLVCVHRAWSSGL